MHENTNSTPEYFFLKKSIFFRKNSIEPAQKVLFEITLFIGFNDESDTKLSSLQSSTPVLPSSQIIPFFSATPLDSLRSQDGITADFHLAILSLLPTRRCGAYFLGFRSRRPSQTGLIRVSAPAVPGSARTCPPCSCGRWD
jgi:hypothetical protein